MISFQGNFPTYIDRVGKDHLIGQKLTVDPSDTSTQKLQSVFNSNANPKLNGWLNNQDEYTVLSSFNDPQKGFKVNIKTSNILKERIIPISEKLLSAFNIVGRMPEPPRPVFTEADWEQLEAGTTSGAKPTGSTKASATQPDETLEQIKKLLDPMAGLDEVAEVYVAPAHLELLKNANEARDICLAVFKDDGRIPAGWQKLDSTSNDETGFKAIAYENNNQIIIAARGTDDELDAINDFQMVFGSVPNQYNDMRQFYNQIKEENPDKEIILAGHSLGGSLAQLVASATGEKAITFNAFGAAALEGRVGDGFGFAWDENNIVNFCMSDDVVCNASPHLGSNYYIDAKDPRAQYCDSTHRLQAFKHFNLEDPRTDKAFSNITPDGTRQMRDFRNKVQLYTKAAQIGLGDLGRGLGNFLK